MSDSPSTSLRVDQGELHSIPKCSSDYLYLHVCIILLLVVSHRTIFEVENGTECIVDGSVGLIWIQTRLAKWVSREVSVERVSLLVEQGVLTFFLVCAFGFMHMYVVCCTYVCMYVVTYYFGYRSSTYFDHFPNIHFSLRPFRHYTV